MATAGLSYRFGEFLLDTSDRQLWKGDARVSLNARYLDTLELLVREHGQLVKKERFFDEVWGDVIVSDSALTQCIKEIRRQLGDDASNPRYIQTAPRHGYRLIAPVEIVTTSGPSYVSDQKVQEGIQDDAATGSARATELKAPFVWDAVRWCMAGTLGGGVAGIFGGILYGSALGYTPAEPGLGTASILLVALSINVVVGLVGGFGVSSGMAAVGLITRSKPGWSIVGAAFGGLLVGGLTKLLGVDAFTLLFGQVPPGITGGLEGAALGAAIAFGVRLSLGTRSAGGPDSLSPWRPVVGGGLAGAVTGALIPVAGGHLLGGSLELIAHSFPSSRLQLDILGRFFGELHFGITTQVILGGIEGLLFGSCVVGAIVLAQKIRPSVPQ
jgi:DNA-binding winged helix-turn-helix (wHTH) protein